VIGIERSLRHLAWADTRLFEELAALLPDALEARYAPSAASVGDLAVHIVSGAEWYAYVLTGEQWTDLQVPRTTADLGALAVRLAHLDALLLAQVELPDDRVSFEYEDGHRQAFRSTVLTQASMHATEHRAQIACALEVAGFPRIDLDAYDLWAFEADQSGTQ
jgi:uncharacterized damage-inducible protein DinB